MAFVFFIPLTNLVVFEAFGTFTRLVGLLAAGAGVFSIAASGRLRIPNTVFVLCLLFFLWAFVSYSWSINLGAAESTLQTYGQLLGMLWLIWEFAPSAREQGKVMTAYVVGALITALQTLARYLQGSSLYSSVDSGRYSPEGFDPNSVGVLLGMSIAMAFFLAASHSRGFKFWFFRGHCVIAALAVLLTGSRGATLATLAGVSLLPWSSWAKSASQKVALAATVVAAALLITFAVPQSTWKRITSTGEEIKSGEVSGRGKIWKAGVVAFTKHPIIGVGPGGFRLAITPILGYGHVAHNVYLTVLVENGIIGFAIHLCIYGYLLAIILHLPALERRSFLAVLACWAVGSMSLSTLGTTETWLVVGLIASQTGLPERARTRRPEAALGRLSMLPHGSPRTAG